MDAFGIENHGYSPLISQKYVVKGDFEVYDGMDLLHHAMLNTLPNINKDGGKDEHGKTIRIPDFEARQKADTLITEIRQAFVEWLHAQPDDFKERLTDLYNRKFNCYVRPRYDGSHQQFPGLDLRGLGIDDLYPSQKDAIWMIKQNGGGICDHEVGTGKTLIMCVAAYEMHRLGLARKPMIIGIKANIHEIARTFRTAYPNARLLYPGKEDFTPENRLRIFSDIKNNNWDCIILTHEQFGKIPQSAEVQQQILRQEMDDIDENLASYEKQGGHVDGWILRGLEKRKENLDAKLHELQETIDAQKDDTVDFQQMGIDHLFVDESHNFKNLMFNTRHSRVSGLGNTDGSKKAMNLLYAIRTIQQRTGRDLGATFLSGTTIANSLTELYLLFKYLRPKELERQDIPCFDAWAAVFAQKTSEFEFSVTNEVISKERFRYFIKVPELAMFYNEITDYRTAADVGIDRPELDEELCQIPMTDDQQAFLDKLVLFAKTGDPEHIGRADLSDGEVKALMLLVTMYSNKLSLDMRLISPAYADSPGNKASRSAANIAEYYRRYEDQKGTQMVFCDLSTYKPGIWNVYSEIKRKLVEDHGIPAQEIRFVQEAASDKVRQAMFDAMNEGKIRVLFGSTQKLGTGVNAQKRIVCMHHLDIPWRPMDLEQRNGRGARKGNIVAKEYAGNKVKAYVYAILRTLDAYKLNLLHNKQQFIDQLKRNRLGARRLDEGAISEDSGMNFAEWMAVVSGNTDLLQKAKLEGRIAALESEQTIFMRTRHEAQSQLQRYTAEIRRRDTMLERLKRDWDYINKVAPPDAKGKRANPLRIDGVESADIVAHGKRLVEIDRTVNTGDDYQKIGTLFDFRILVRTERMQKDGLALTVNKFMVEGLDGIKYTFNNGHLAAEPKTAATNFIRALDTIPSLMATYEKEKKQFTRDIPTFEQQIAAVWPKEEELKRLKAEAESLT
uniref:helicase-related protein n=1 Tax=Alistipes shahii TaxID=328814 RepID=UPI004038F1B6